MTEKSPLDAEREKLRAQGYSEAEISQILIARAVGGGAGMPNAQGMFSNVLSSILAVASYIAGIFTSIRTDLTTILDRSAPPAARSNAVIAIAIKAVVIGVLAYAGWQEWQQHIVSGPQTAVNNADLTGSQARKAKAEADAAEQVAAGEKARSCSDRMKLFSENMGMEDLNPDATIKPGTRTAKMMEKYRKECGPIVGDVIESASPDDRNTKYKLDAALETYVKPYQKIKEATISSKTPLRLVAAGDSVNAACFIGVRLASDFRSGDTQGASNVVEKIFPICVGATVVFLSTNANIPIFVSREPLEDADEAVKNVWRGQKVASDMDKCAHGEANYRGLLACSCRAGVNFGVENPSVSGNEESKKLVISGRDEICQRLAEKFADADGPEAEKKFLESASRASAPKAIKSPPPSPTLTTANPPQKTTAVFDNYDLAGNDLEHVASGSMDACLSSCRENSECRGVTFDKWNRVCFLKGEGKTLWFNAHGVSALIDPDATPEFSTAPIFILRVSKRGFPKTGSTSYAESADDCDASCKATSWCAADTFFRSSHECMLLKTTGEYFPNSDADSGVKRQKNY